MTYKVRNDTKRQRHIEDTCPLTHTHTHTCQALLHVALQLNDVAHPQLVNKQHGQHLDAQPKTPHFVLQLPNGETLCDRQSRQYKISKKNGYGEVVVCC